MTAQERIIIFDTTLRDGEQSSGFHMNEYEKTKIAENLAKMKVDVIEAGFPISSPGDFKSVNAIAKAIDGPVIAGLSRCVEADIRRAGEALEPAIARGKGRIHTFIATSQIHAKDKLRKSEQEIADIAVKNVRIACEYTRDVEFSCEDFGRSETGYIIRIVTAVIKAGATTINLPDTVGYMLPWDMREKVRAAIEGVRGQVDIARVIFSVHNHNDLGLATANTLAAIEGGCRQAELTVNGIGERAGNASMEEFVAIVQERMNDRFAFNLDSALLCETSRMIGKFTGNYPQRNKAVVGVNAFAHEAGIHQDGVIKSKKTYEWMDAERYGNASVITFGPRSGRNALRAKITELGFPFTEDELNRINDNFTRIADAEKEIDDAHLVMAVAGLPEVPDRYRLTGFRADIRNREGDAVITMEVDGKEMTATGSGNGMIDASAHAVNKLTGLDLQVSDYSSLAEESGSDAVGIEKITVKKGKFKVNGFGHDTDTVRGAAKAFIDASNKIAFILDYFSKNGPKVLPGEGMGKAEL
ncbi:MAG: 2-isopropylmalate synthase [Planctomycetota bacterium]